MTKLTDEEIDAIAKSTMEHPACGFAVIANLARAIEAEARKRMKDECIAACELFYKGGYEMGEAADKLRAME